MFLDWSLRQPVDMTSERQVDVEFFVEQSVEKGFSDTNIFL